MASIHYQRVSLMLLKSDGTSQFFKDVADAARHVAATLGLSFKYIKTDLSRTLRKFDKAVGTEFTYKTFNWKILLHDKVTLKKCTHLQCVGFNMDGLRCTTKINLYLRVREANPVLPSGQQLLCGEHYKYWDQTVTTLFPDLVAEGDGIVNQCLVEPNLQFGVLEERVGQLHVVNEKLHKLLPPKPLKSESSGSYLAVVDTVGRVFPLPPVAVAEVPGLENFFEMSAEERGEKIKQCPGLLCNSYKPHRKRGLTLRFEDAQPDESSKRGRLALGDMTNL